MFQYVPNVHGNVCPEICVFPSRVENPVTRGGLRILRINGEGADQPLRYRAGMALMHMQDPKAFYGWDLRPGSDYVKHTLCKAHSVRQ